MKKTMYLLTLAILAAAISAAAHAEDIFVSNKSNHSVRVITTEDEAIKDSVCLYRGDTVQLRDYTPGKIYRVHTLYQYAYCEGVTREISNDFMMFGMDVQADVNDNYMVFRKK